MKKGFIWICFLFLSIGGAFMQEFHDADIGDLTVSLNVTKLKRSISAVINITNIKDYDIFIPKWNIDGVDVTNDWFVITNQKKKIATYKGVMVKRPPPTMEQCIKLIPKQSLSFEVDLSKYYSFPWFSDLLNITYDGPLGESNTVIIHLKE